MNYPLICSIHDTAAGSFALLLFKNELDACRAFCYFLKDKDYTSWRFFKLLAFGHFHNYPNPHFEGYKDINDLHPYVIADGVACMDIIDVSELGEDAFLDLDIHILEDILNTTEIWENGKHYEIQN